MADVDIRTIQLHLAGMMDVLDRVFREHDLCYYLADGTMLGAVRHKGFIPWDDDLDIAMPRKDYEALIEHAEEWLPERYKLICLENEPTYPLLFAKILDTETTLVSRRLSNYPFGAYIDIFPLDGMTSDKRKATRMIKSYKFHRQYIRAFVINSPDSFTGLKRWWLLTLRKMINLPKRMRKMREMQMRYDYESSEYVINHDDRHRGVALKEVYGTPTPIEFEGRMFMGVEEPDDYLKGLYGADYMEIPPVEKQRQHNFVHVDLHMPYSEYFKQK